MERTRIIPFASNKCRQSSTSVDLRKAMSISCAKPARSNAKANLFKANGINKDSPYRGSCFILATKHAKSIAIAPSFLENIGTGVIEYVCDTDQLGTFSGEIERKDSALECARCKCELALEKLGSGVEFVLASEGSFGPHSFIPFLPRDQEILYFIDRRHDFHLHLSHVSANTNYQMKSITSFDELKAFLTSSQFPSHGLILRPNNKESSNLIFKGVCDESELKEAFKRCQKKSSDSMVWVETDMRAHMNPSRMEVIRELANKLSLRLASHCPKCSMPGWGIVSTESGLRCEDCGLPTELTKYEIFGCVKCAYEEVLDRKDCLKQASPRFCNYCNP
jgi:hypothetical protein